MRNMSTMKRKMTQADELRTGTLSLQSSADISVQAATRSRLRGLVQDVAGCLAQQMYFWGCDVGHKQGNLLVKYGMMRIARAERHGEGSSRYRMPWLGGTFEVHSFCAGWYPSDESEKGALFVRGKECLYECRGSAPLTPGRYELDRYACANRDEMLSLCVPILAWVANYERWIAANTEVGYRERCWEALGELRHGKPWLPPQVASEWLASFLKDSEATPRAKSVLRSSGKGENALSEHRCFYKNA